MKWVSRHRPAKLRKWGKPPRGSSTWGLKCESPQLILQGYKAVAEEMPSSHRWKGVSHGESRVRAAILAVPGRCSGPEQVILLGPQM